MLVGSFDVAVFVALGVCEAAVLCAVRSRFRGTTLLAAWWWTLLTTFALTLTVASGVLEGGDALRFAAAVLSFCPMMAVLGAKRPQHQMWQFIVLSMWAVLALPAAEFFLLRRGQTLEIHGVRQAFLVGLIGLGVLNWLPTRFAIAALLAAAGQGMLLAEFFPGLIALEHSRAWILAAVCFVAATGAVWRLQVADEGPGSGWDRVWRDFRDEYGALWALRIMERFNTTASAQHWMVRLRWSGVRPANPHIQTDREAAPSTEWDATLSSLLRRFVSAEWIAKRR